MRQAKARLSAGARRLLEIPAAEPVGDLIARLPVDADDAPAARARRSALAARSGTDFDLRLARVGGAGALRLIGGAVAGRDGAARPSSASFSKPTKRCSWREEAAQRSAHLRSILETALDGMVVIDVAGRIQSFNSSRAAHVRLFRGRSARRKRQDPDGRRRPLRAMTATSRAISTTGERRIIGIGRIVTGQRKDGSQFPLHLSIGETQGRGAPAVHRLHARPHRGASQREAACRRLQTELAHISRLSALGEMGSALAHELNQPLAAIGNYITGSRRLLADAPSPSRRSVDSALERAAEQVLRAGQIIRRLRDFVSRRRVGAQRREPRQARRGGERAGSGRRARKAGDAQVQARSRTTTGRSSTASRSNRCWSICFATDRMRWRARRGANLT